MTVAGLITNLGRRWRLASATGIAAALTLCGSAVAQPADDVRAQGQIGEICRNVLGLERGEAQFAACAESLAASAAGLGEDRALGRARAQCLTQGLAPESAAFNVCELNGASVERGAGRSAAQANVAPRAASSYFYASPGQVHRREQFACAALGLDPAGGGFDGCVASLHAAMFEADNPAQ